MFIHAMTGVLFAYLLIRFVLPSRLGAKGKVVLALVLFVASQEHLFNRLFGGLSSPELPAPVLMVQGWLFISAILLFLFVLARDIVRLIKRFLPQKLFSGLPGGGTAASQSGGPASESRRAFVKGGAALFPAAVAARGPILSGLVLGPAAVGVFESVKVPDVHPIEARLANLPKALDGFKLVQVSDMHVSPLLRSDWARGVVERINELEPDLVVFTGDLVDGIPAHRADSVRWLAKLKSRYGVYGCAGNHEYYNGFSEWMDVFSELGIRMLLNEHAVIGAKGEELVLAGITDVAAERFSLPLPNLGAALADTPDKAVRILMDHRPGNAVSNAQHKVDLQLSGHTHGGHMPGMTEVVCLFNQGFLRGWYSVNGMPLYVSTGAGLWNGFPVRLGVPSEIALMTLRAQGATGA
ncbi:metallophosphoesterase [Desulfovibrio sp. OttesenSCG-928-G15]|nr:metallophosphoesterase [Desulfovibrio sp. OttesenSCG-928-G15]